MKIFSTTHDFPYSWTHLTSAHWQKYPNPHSSHVIATDVLRREISPCQTKLLTERLITCKQRIPSWVSMILGADEVNYVREVSIVDLSEKTLTLRSVNLSMVNILKVSEVVVYKPHPLDPGNKTIFEQEAQITAFVGLRSIKEKIEEWCVERFGQNARYGRMGFDDVLERVIGPTKKLVALGGENLDVVKEKTEELMNDADRVISQALDKTGGLIDDADKVLNQTMGKTGALLDGAGNRVRSGILAEYYDVIKNALPSKDP